MIIEGIIVSSTLLLINNWDMIKRKRKWGKICASKSKFTNNLGKTIKILKYYEKDYGYCLYVELPYGYTQKQLQDDLSVFREGLRVNSILVEAKGNQAILRCIKGYQFKEYKPIKLRANELLIGDGITKPILVDMNKFPHMLIGGETGTGKSRILLAILTNLINSCSNVQIYLLQARKNDLGVFNNCKQVVCNSRDLIEVVNSLNKINKECIRREKLIDNTKGYYSIKDYNQANREQLDYIYVVIEEFSFLNPSRGDYKEDKKIKNECLMLIKNIVNVGRSSGVFLITALQKPTNSSIPSDIKAQLVTRVSLKISDSPASIVILGNGNATDLGNREMIVRTLGEQKGYSYTIDHNLVKSGIEGLEIEKVSYKENDFEEIEEFEEIETTEEVIQKEIEEKEISLDELIGIIDAFN